MIAFPALFRPLKNRLSLFRRNHTYWTLAAGPDGFALLGNPRDLHPYNRLYPNGHEPPVTRSHLYGGGTALAPGLLKQHGLVVVSDLDLPEDRAEKALRVPRYVPLTIPLPDDPRIFFEHLPRSGKNDVRKAERSSFAFEITTDPGWAGEFYRRYYEPSMRGRHGDEAYIMPEAGVTDLMRSGACEFIQVWLEGRCVAAFLNRIGESDYELMRLGWLDNDPHWVQAGAIPAAYWFTIRRAIALGKTELQLGGTPAYLENGVLRFKAKWGGRVQAGPSGFGYRFLLLDPGHPSCRRFLSRYSLLAFGPAGSLMILSPQAPAETGLPDRFLRDFDHWFILRQEPKRSGECPELPASLQVWYDRFLW
ncbi:GNAT family N-acetyltransferase [Larkinella soli]|uniref:GNAT family N-acetyltransferase n=1 Tax=Larkinella soli TaxID=1770527 RepID=UPI000FFB7ED6|nr:GNAT family N-acetyltransferase [Larkinella soli]